MPSEDNEENVRPMLEKTSTDLKDKKIFVSPAGPNTSTTPLSIILEQNNPVENPGSTQRSSIECIYSSFIDQSFSYFIGEN